MARKSDVIDDDGNIIDPPPPDHAVRAIVWLIEYGRRRGFLIGPTVQVGDVIVQVRDLRLEAEREPRATPDTPASDSAFAELLGDR